MYVYIHIKPYPAGKSCPGGDKRPQPPVEPKARVCVGKACPPEHMYPSLDSCSEQNNRLAQPFIEPAPQLMCFENELHASCVGKACPTE